ncbi:hypothetical protein [Paucilactobacillus nenjiangensis]|uniref:Uncharacterized protein n=2 Tax=Paucilactobacillus nenjiangensis TaxID=1296540 RepID=A0A5P1X1X1_9LACO|nr:hypothetical protein [Paucilactobacillus nenjiangensis]QER67910.1 hypothetical protein F0161_08660 [Paucilactobacillus nenjiangensis]
MLDVTGSISNLQWTTEHHFLHIQARHEFMRAIAVQFELAYSDFRAIQMALQLDNQTDLLEKVTAQYNEVFQYEMAFVRGGLDEFDNQFKGKIDQYQTSQASLLATLNDILKLQPSHAPKEI